MKERIVDEQIRLVPYYRNDAVSLRWYQDAAVCKQVDNRDTPYDLALLHRMYDYLYSHGDCYYIEYLGILVGDVALLDSGVYRIKNTLVAPTQFLPAILCCLRCHPCCRIFTTISKNTIQSIFLVSR